MTTTTTARANTTPEAEQLRRDVARTQRLACEAIDALDIPGAIAHCRALRSLLWRAQNQKIDLTEPAPETESSEA